MEKRKGTSSSAGSGNGDLPHMRVNRLTDEEKTEIELTQGRTKYSPGDFIVPAADSQGHTEREWCRVQPTVDRAMDVVLRSRKFPFRTKGDVMRWCIVHGLRHLDKLEPMPGLIGRLDTVNDIMKEELYWHEYMDTFRKLENIVNMHLGENGRGEAIRMIARVRAEVMRIEEGFWRDKCMEQLRQKFGHLLDGAGKVGVLPPVPAKAVVMQQNKRNGGGDDGAESE